MERRARVRKLRSIPKEWVKKKGRAYRVPKEPIRNFVPSDDSKAVSIITNKMIREQAKEAARLMSIIQEVGFDRGKKWCDCATCRRVNKFLQTLSSKKK